MEWAFGPSLPVRKRQGRALIPAWGNAPGYGRKSETRAESPFQQFADVAKSLPHPNAYELGRAVSAWEMIWTNSADCYPRLVSNGPLAQTPTSREWAAPLALTKMIWTRILGRCPRLV
jgi:hypothetical protein